MIRTGESDFSQYYNRFRPVCKTRNQFHLYKVREKLKIYKYDGAVKAALNITEGWKFFGKIINNNGLRHAEVSGTAPPVTRQDVDRLYALARKWITAYLQKRGLPVVD